MTVLNEAKKKVHFQYQRRTLIAAALVAVLGITLAPTHVFAQTQPTDKAQRILDSWTNRSKLKGLKLGVAMRGLNGKIQASHDADRLYNPASGTKLLTTAAAMLTWKLNKQFTTRIYGNVQGDRTDKDGLWIVGGGDPKLLSEDLESLADTLKKQGLKHVAGPLHIDTSVFEGKNLPPAYDQKSTTSGYRASIGALGVDYGAVTLVIAPHPKLQQPKIALESTHGYAVLENVATHENGKKDELTYTLASLPDGRMKITIGGKLGRQHPKFTHRLRMLNPNLGTGNIFRHLLKNRGITLVGPVKEVRTRPSSIPLLVEHRGPPLGTLLKDLNTHSNNFMAETVFRHLGKDWNESQQVVSSAIEGLGLKRHTFKVVNGSGLYKATTVTPSAMVNLLTGLAERKKLAQTFRATLAVSGRPGTLHNRMRGRMRGLVQGKTGTLNEVVSLSGYLRTRRSGVLAFAIFVNDASPDRTARIRREIDRLIRSWARL